VRCHGNAGALLGRAGRPCHARQLRRSALPPCISKVSTLRYRRDTHAGRVILDGRVAVTDVPVDHDDRVYLVYLVERHIQSKADLDGLTAEYTAHSQACGQPAAIASRQVAEQLAAVLVAAPS